MAKKEDVTLNPEATLVADILGRMMARELLINAVSQHHDRLTLAFTREGLSFAHDAGEKTVAQGLLNLMTAARTESARVATRMALKGNAPWDAVPMLARARSVAKTLAQEAILEVLNPPQPGEAQDDAAE